MNTVYILCEMRAQRLALMGLGETRWTSDEVKAWAAQEQLVMDNTVQGEMREEGINRYQLESQPQERKEGEVPCH